MFGKSDKVEFRSGRDPGAVVPTSLRDWFAGMALTGLIAPNAGAPDLLARCAYDIADALMAERAKRSA